MLTRRKVWIGTTLAAAVLATVVLANDGRTSKRSAATAPRTAASDVKAFPARPTPPKPTWLGWKVEVLPTVSGEQRDYQLALANVLSRMEFVPADRAGHFQALDTPRYRLDGWHGSIESASPTPNGAVVNLRVTPRVASSIGASVTVVGGVIERYEITDGGVRYLGAAMPPGGSFQGVITD